MPENVHIFKDEVEMKKCIEKRILQFIYMALVIRSRHVMETMTGDYTKDGRCGLSYRDPAWTWRGTSEHGRYAPFHVKELAEKSSITGHLVISINANSA